MLRGASGLAGLLVLSWVAGARAAPPAQAARAQDPLAEEVGSLIDITGLQAREIEALKKRIAALEEDLRQSVEDLQRQRALLEEHRLEGGTSRARIEALEGRLTHQGRALPWLIPGASLRVRMLYDRNRMDLDSGRGDSDLYLQHRLRLGVTLQAGPGVQGVFVVQDSRDWGAGRSTGSGQAGLDLYQGYLALEDPGRTGLRLAAGRFAMDLGSGRQVSSRDFDNVGQTFDGVRLSWRRPKVLSADLFATFVRGGWAPVFREGWGQDPYGVFTGLYLSTDALPWLDADLYGLYQDDGFQTETNKVGTVGARLELRPVKGLRLEAEAAVQFGRVTLRDLEARTAEATHLATAYAAEARYEFQGRTRPWIALSFASASGDANPWDGRDVAYRPLYPEPTRFLGQLGLFTWQGVWDLGPSVGLSPVEGLRLSLAWHFFSLSSDGGMLAAFDADTFRVSDPRPPSSMGRAFHVPAGGSRFLGHEGDFSIRWQALPWLSVEGNYGLFQPGAAARRGEVLSVGERTPGGDGAVPVPFWKREHRMGADLSQRLLVGLLLSL